MDVIRSLKIPGVKASEVDFTLPYPAYIRRQPYPSGYIEHPLVFPKHDGERGNAREHICSFCGSNVTMAYRG